MEQHHISNDSCSHKTHQFQQSELPARLGRFDGLINVLRRKRRNFHLCCNKYLDNSAMERMEIILMKRTQGSHVSWENLENLSQSREIIHIKTGNVWLLKKKKQSQSIQFQGHFPIFPDLPYIFHHWKVCQSFSRTPGYLGTLDLKKHNGNIY